MNCQTEVVNYVERNLCAHMWIEFYSRFFIFLRFAAHEELFLKKWGVYVNFLYSLS